MASAQQIMPMPAIDGQTLFMQPFATQRLFMDTYGVYAAEQWVAEHNTELLGITGTPRGTIEVAGVTVFAANLAAVSNIATPGTAAEEPYGTMDGR